MPKANTPAPTPPSPPLPPPVEPTTQLTEDEQLALEALAAQEAAERADAEALKAELGDEPYSTFVVTDGSRSFSYGEYQFTVTKGSRVRIPSSLVPHFEGNINRGELVQVSP